MEENKEEKGKYIFTDSFRTKDIIWEAYTGFIESYHDYIMFLSIKRIDPIILAAMNKYAEYFFDEIEDFLDHFKDQLKDTEEIKKLIEKDNKNKDQWRKVRKFFAKFMSVSGIKNIVKEKEIAGKSITHNR